MDFSFNDEQKQLQELLSKFIQRDYSFDKRRACQALPDGFSREVWSQLADMGLLGLPFAEQYGGLGAGVAETLLVMTAIGNGLMVEPYLSTVVMAGGLIDRCGDEAQKRALLPEIAAGKRIVVAALAEPGARYDLNRVETTVSRKGGDIFLSGRKAVVLHGGQADQFIVSARSSGDVAATEGISLYLVDRGAAGISIRDYRTVDGLRAADIVLNDVRVGAEALLGAESGAFAAIDAAADSGTAALCAEAVGVMETLNALTLEHLRTRQQFGHPIGRFQVLQHRAADMFIHAEQSKSMAYLAAMKLSSDDVAERRRIVSAAKVHIGRSGRMISQSAVQLHGGMGVTHELAAAHYAKRLTMIDFVLGDSDHHLNRFIKG